MRRRTPSDRTESATSRSLYSEPISLYGVHETEDPVERYPKASNEITFTGTMSGRS